MSDTNPFHSATIPILAQQLAEGWIPCVDSEQPCQPIGTDLCMSCRLRPVVAKGLERFLVDIAHEVAEEMRERMHGQPSEQAQRVREAMRALRTAASTVKLHERLKFSEQMEALRHAVERLQ